MTPLAPFLSYLLKVILLSGITLGYYRLFLRRNAAHTFNRYYLLAAVFLALWLPLLRIPRLHWNDPVAEATQKFLHRGKIVLSRNPDLSPQQIVDDYYQTQVRRANYILIAYGLISLFVGWPLVRSLFVIRRLKRRYTPERVADISVYPTQEAGTPFSFFNHLFWNDAIPTDTEKGQLIFRHELYHIRQLHTVDILVLETIRRLFWCNPFFFLILRELKLVHEFLADRYALQSNAQRFLYAEYLVWQSQGVNEIPHLVHSFYHTELKNRVTMILHPVPTHIGGITRWLSLPLSLLLLVAFTGKGYPHYKGTRVPEGDRPILQDKILTRYYIRHLRYPRIALEKGIEGKVWFDVEIGPDGLMHSAGYGAQEVDTEGGKIPTLTVTAKALRPDQVIAEPEADSLRSDLVKEVMDASHDIYNDPVFGCPSGTYYFSVVFKIEK